MTTNAAENNLVLAKRRAILAKILSSSSQRLTLEKMAYEMRKDPWVSSQWPSYSTTTAKSDLDAIIGLVDSEISDLTMPYLARQLGIMEDTISTLLKIVNDDSNSVYERTKAASVLRSWLDMEISIVGNYPAQRLQIDKREITFDLDTFLAMRKKIEEDFGSAVDGEWEEQED